MLLAKKGIVFLWSLVFNVLCRSCSNHTTFVELLYLGKDKSKKVYIGYKVKTTECLNLHIESKYHASVQILLYISSQINNIHKYFI